MIPKTISATVSVPYDRAICHVADHPHRRCVFGRTAFGPGKFSYLHKFQNVRIEDVPIEHRSLEQPLRQLGLVFLRMMEAQDQRLTSSMYVDGPYPAYEDGATRFVGPSVGLDDINRGQDQIVAAGGFVTDYVTYHLSGVFVGPEIQDQIVADDMVGERMIQCPSCGVTET